MGKESYRIGVILEENIDLIKVKNKFLELQMSLKDETSDGDIYLEKEYAEGFLELLLRQSNNNSVVINFRIAKPNSVEIIEKLKTLLLKFNEENAIKYIKDFEFKQNILGLEFKDLKKRFETSKKDFEQWYPGIKSPIRSDEVFEEYRKMHPDEYTTTEY